MKPLLLRSLVLSVLFTLAATSSAAATIVETANEARTFKIFVSALKKTGLAETLQNSRPYTVFAPSDQAFGKLPPGSLEALMKDKEKLNKVLAYHVIPGKVLVTEIKPGKTKTVQGDELTLTSDNGKVTVNGANVTQSDINADNGVIHEIDTVVMPAN
ncbi:MAG: fasciclin domain-containing protein [Burkholderiaceae bacterium]